MNDRKICFIMCVNEQLYEEECMKYINQLIVPKGYEIEVVSIYEAPSMTAGYNKAMQQSDAKYKIYLHQDVFVVYKEFLCKILDIFQKPDVGMIGMVGAPVLAENAVIWDSKRVGKIYSSNVLSAGMYTIGEAQAPYEEVQVVDGLLIATQYDIPWREDLFKGWDFYDISQSMEFRKNNYKVVVPYMEKPWCFHDDGYVNLSSYFKWRDVFLVNY